MILSRYLEKADYGTYKQVLYIYNTLLAVFTFGLPKAYSYFLPRINTNQAKSLIKKITLIFFILGTVFSLSLYLLSSTIASILNNDNLTIALRIFSPVPLLMLPTMGLEGILATYKRTQLMSVYIVLTRIIMILCVCIPIVIYELNYLYTLVGFVIASFFSFIIALWIKGVIIKEFGSEICYISYKDILRFSIPLLLASFWGSIILATDQFFISRYFGNRVFAEFSNGAIDLPFIGMISGACATVLSPIFSKLSSDKSCIKETIYPIWMNVFEKTVKLTYPLILYCMFFSETIMTLLYGKEYSNSSIYFQLKLLTNFFTVIVYAPLIINIGKVKFYSNVHLYGAIILILLEYISLKSFSSALFILVVSVLCQIGRILVMMVFIGKYFKISFFQMMPIKVIIKVIFFSSILLVLIKYIFELVEMNSLLTIICSSFTYFVLYFVISHFFKLDYMSIVKPFFNK